MCYKSTLPLLSAVFILMSGFRTSPTPAAGPSYTKDGKLEFPEHYREWVYLSSGFDMSYDPASKASGHHMFDNVFVNPEAYKSFVETGKWPDGTLLVLEGRGAEGKGSINQNGNFQGVEVMAMEVHAKDSKRFPGQWAFFSFDDSKVGKLFPQSADCYSCHQEHAAVDTTFVQFYPTLLKIAKSKGTLSQSYQKQSGNQAR